MSNVIYTITRLSCGKRQIHPINPFSPNAPFLYPLKIPENLTVFWYFQRVEEGCIGNKWVERKNKYTLFKLIAWSFERTFILSASMLKSTKISKNLVDFIFQNVIKYFAEFNFCEATALCRVHFSELDANWKK